MRLIDSLSQGNNDVAGAQSIISQGSGSQNDASSSLTQPHLAHSRPDAGLRGALAYGVGKSRLSQYVQ